MMQRRVFTGAAAAGLGDDVAGVAAAADSLRPGADKGVAAWGVGWGGGRGG